MTEEAWLATTNITSTLEFLQAKVSERKLRLYLCGGCRCPTVLFHSPASMEAVEIVERYADDQANADDMRTAIWIAESATFGFDFEPDFWERHPEERPDFVGRLVELGAVAPSALEGGDWIVNDEIRRRLLHAAELVYVMTYTTLDEEALRRAGTEISELGWPGQWLRDCIFGNPFRPVAFDPAWRTSTAVALAQQMYDSRDFALMPILGDALQDAGCDNADILDHCRGDGPHVRGCWVVDLILGKS